MPTEWTPKNSEEYGKWFEKNQNNVSNFQTFRIGLDLIRKLESDISILKSKVK